VVTRSAREFAKLHGRYFPVNFASSGSSTIGGNISTNAGGLHAVRYGTMRRWTAGVAGVTGTGEIFRTRPGLFKDNSGYDLKEILIGSEGTLACITEAYLNVTDPPKETRIVILSCDDFSAIGNAVGEILPSGMTLHAIEFFDRTSQKILSEWEGTVRFFESGRCFILVEYENFDEESEFAFFDGLSQRLGLIDVAYAQTEPQKREFWRRRELISESLLRNHSVYKADLAIPLVNMGLFLGEVETILSREAPEFSYTTFGHAGDGNIHLNLLKKRERDSFFHISPALEERLYRTVSKYGGSPSAEHGIGLVKTHLLKYSKTGEEIRIMKEIKRAFDPRSILNPGKILEI
jgi:FAD/FMN-containing dehydrogenase